MTNPKIAKKLHSITDVNASVINCNACPRLVAWREQVAREKKAAFKDEEYWGRPVPGIGDEKAKLMIVGLAPAAHGANRTGRMFTGDRSGDWLYRALYKAGYANQPTSVHIDDGLQLQDVYISAPVRCAPPANKPTTLELATCRPWIQRELELLRPTLKVIVCLGMIGYQALWKLLAASDVKLPKPRPKFAHGLEVELLEFTVICSFHPSQQNTFTGKLTEEMFDHIFSRSKELSS